MNHPHRFTLQPYQGKKSRLICPQCQDSRRTFKRYIDTETNTILAEHVGRCDRADNCGYHYTPRQYFAQNPIAMPVKPHFDPVPVRGLFNQLPASFMHDSMQQKHYSRNNFVMFLAGMFGWEKALSAAERYHIGTSKHWPGATVFWQLDRDEKIRTGKIMLFDKHTCKRVKQPFNHIAWAHRLLSDDFLLEQCFFGEHLLAENEMATVAICESEKTAVIASIMMPGYIWLAAGSLHGLDPHKCKALKQRTVILFPDVGAHSAWLACARTLNLKLPAATFLMHDEMELTAAADERATGADMADRWIAEHLLNH